MSRIAVLTGWMMLCTVGSAAGQIKGSGHGAIERPPIAAAALTSMPIKELTVFKDGHAMIVHEAEMPTEATGDVVLDTLPAPVLGTFWPYLPDDRAQLRAVVAGTRTVTTEHRAGHLRALLTANPRAHVRITEVTGDSYSAIVLGTDASCTPDAATPHAAPPAPLMEVLLLEVQEGVRALPFAHIRDVTFREPPHRSIEVQEERTLLTYKLDWGTGAPFPEAKIGLTYVQRGVRWIPSYRVSIDGKGQALIRLQATLINDLADFENAVVNLVVGVPSIGFANTTDPISLQETLVQVVQHTRARQQQADYFSNAIMSQTVASYGFAEAVPGGTSDGLDALATDAARYEDLFVFTLPALSLRKGERMVVPVAEYRLEYTDVYTLDVPATPPLEWICQVDEGASAAVLQALRTPKVMHRIRLKNCGPYPLTTAPAVVLWGDRLLSQGLMTYAPVGGTADVEVTTAVDILVSKSETESQRTPNALNLNGTQYSLIELDGTILLTNRRGTPIEVEVQRHVLGKVTAADREGTSVQTNWLEYDGPASTWRGWWRAWAARYGGYGPLHLNGLGRVSWRVSLAAEEQATLTYAWSYYWR